MNIQIVNISSWSVINEYYILNALSVQFDLAELQLARTYIKSANIQQVRISAQPARYYYPSWYRIDMMKHVFI